MGVATYYLKARFSSDEEAKKQFELIKAFFLEGVKAEEFWQEHREMERRNERDRFWLGFRCNFPIVYEMLKGSGLADGDCNNNLAGNINFGSEDDIEYALQLDGEIILYHATISHGADWQTMCCYLKSAFGAVSTAYLSDEYMDPFDALEV